MPSDAAGLINKFTKLSDTKVKVDWNGFRTTIVETLSSARFEDGILHINSVYSSNMGDVLKITGGAIGLKIEDVIYKTIYVNNSWASNKLNSGYVYCIGTSCN